MVPDRYAIKLMPNAEATYRQLKRMKVESRQPLSLEYFRARPFVKMLERVDVLIRSMADPGNAHLDQPLLECLDLIQTRSLGSTLLYFLRFPERKIIRILHMTEFDSTNSYTRFSGFLASGGVTVLSRIGVRPPSSDIGSSELVN